MSDTVTWSDPCDTVTTTAGDVTVTTTSCDADLSVSGVNPSVSSHSALTGLAADDHTQYHTDARGDARYPLIAHTHALSALTQSSANTFDSPQWSGSAWVAKDIHSGVNRVVLKSELNALGEFTAIGTGSGASNSFLVAGYAFEGRVGFLTSSTGTTATGVAGCGTALVDQVVLGTSTTWTCDMIRISALSTGTDRFAIDSGLTDNRAGGSTAPVDGVYFQYSDNVNSGKFICCAMDNNSLTTVDSTITVAINTFYRLEIKVVIATAYYYINGSLVGTISTGVPTGTTRVMGKSCLIRKSVGTSSVSMINDYTHLIQDSAR